MNEFELGIIVVVSFTLFLLLLHLAVRFACKKLEEKYTGSFKVIDKEFEEHCKKFTTKKELI